jgi:hypothetical protein
LRGLVAVRYDDVMTEQEKLIQEFLSRGGKVTKVPEKGARRKEFEAPVLKSRRILADLKARAQMAKDA